MIRDIDLISYLPQFIKEYKEIKVITNTENPEFQLLSDKTETVKDNQFIITCNEKGIGRFEKLLKLTPSDDDTLEARKSRILSRWNIGLPYTYRVLIEKLNTLCGKGKYKLISNFNKYELEIKTSLTLSGQVEALETITSYMIPANIVVKTKNELTFNRSKSLYVVGTVVKHIKKEVG